jgi:hypothetical protein
MILKKLQKGRRGIPRRLTLSRNSRFFNPAWDKMYEDQTETVDNHYDTAESAETRVKEYPDYDA